MQHYVFDSYAWIGFFRKEPGYQQIADLLSLADEGNCYLSTSGINLGEVFYMLRRKNGDDLAKYAIDFITGAPGNIVLPSQEVILRAAKIKSENKLSFADAFAIELTTQLEGILVSNDPEIKTLAPILGFTCYSMGDIFLP